jgi:hypothetical protein
MRARTRFTAAAVLALSLGTMVACAPPPGQADVPTPGVPAAPDVAPATRVPDGRSAIRVTNTSGDVNTQGSLPWAVNRAAYNGNGIDLISFDIPGGGPHIIRIGTELRIPAGEPALIDARTQSGYDGSPKVWVFGQRGVSSLFLNGASGTTIRGFGMMWYDNNAVTLLPGGHNNVVADNWMGFFFGDRLYKTTEQAQYPAGVGIQSNDNLIHNNVISGVYNGIVAGEDVSGGWSGTTYRGNVIQYNKVGTDPTGGGAYGNASDGVFFGSGMVNNRIGPHNLFSGNASAGVEIFQASSSKNLITRNRIGLDLAGTKAVPNGELGVMLARGTKENSIEDNLIGGNRLGNISIESSAVGNWVLRNHIGVDANQRVVGAAQNVGISIASGAGWTTVDQNVIGGHATHGVIIHSSNNNAVTGNWIGRTKVGHQVGNGAAGVYLMSASNNRITGNAFGTNNMGTVRTEGWSGGNVIG